MESENGREEQALPIEEADFEETEEIEADEDGEEERLRRDMEEFERKFPEVSLLALEKNADFRKFCGSRLYKESAAELYKDYLEFTGEVRRRSETRAARSTGSGRGQSAGGLTPAEQRSLEEWNRAYPAMKMTAREFRSRG